MRKLMTAAVLALTVASVTLPASAEVLYFRYQGKDVPISGIDTSRQTVCDLLPLVAKALSLTPKSFYLTFYRGIVPDDQTLQQAGITSPYVLTVSMIDGTTGWCGIDTRRRPF